MSSVRIDLNCDLGEQLPNVDDRLLMRHLTSCNIACGGHAGDDGSMRRAVAAAIQFGVAIGAHPSYPDHAGFGRRTLVLPAAELTASILQQCRRLAAIAEAGGTALSHVKAHGALYNDIARDDAVTNAFLRGVQRLDAGVAVFLPAGTAAIDRARAAGITPVAEAFADRTYETSGRLRPRSQPGAILSEVDDVLAQVEGIVLRGEVMTPDGPIPIVAETMCLHGDTPGAEALLPQVRSFLEQGGVDVRPAG